MPVNKQLLKQLLLTHKNDKCANTSDSAAELATTLSDTEALVRSCQNVQAVPFILWNDFFNTAGIFASRTAPPLIRYKWGDKVFVDFGCGNIQTELSFPHPAIVLYNFRNSVLVVPTTSDDGPVNLAKDIERVVIKAKQDGAIFPKDTIININQIRIIHKYRIIKNLRCNVKSYIVDAAEVARQNAIHGKDTFTIGMDLATCIQRKIAYIYAESQMQMKDQQIFQQHQQIKQLQTDLKTAQAELETARQKLLELTTPNISGKEPEQNG